MIVKPLIICVGSVTSTIEPHCEFNNETGAIVGILEGEPEGMRLNKGNLK